MSISTSTYNTISLYLRHDPHECRARDISLCALKSLIKRRGSETQALGRIAADARCTSRCLRNCLGPLEHVICCCARMPGVEWPALEELVNSLHTLLTQSYSTVWLALLALLALYLLYRNLPSRSPPRPPLPSEMDRVRAARLNLLASSAPVAPPKQPAPEKPDPRIELMKPKSQRQGFDKDSSPLDRPERGRYVPQSRTKSMKGS